MTQGNDPTTTPEVPAWLNLDAAVPPDLRERMASFAEEARAAQADVDGLAVRAYRLHQEYDRTVTTLVGDAGDSVLDLINDVSGFWAMHHAVYDLGDSFIAAAEGKGNQSDREPAWLAEEKEKGQ